MRRHIKLRRFHWLIAAVSILVITGGLIFWFKHLQHPSSPMLAAPWVMVQVVKSQDMPFEATAIGTLVAQSIQITPEIAGHVEKILFQDGMSVEKDAPLMQLNNAVYKAQYTSAQAKLAYSLNDYQRKVLLSRQGAIAKQALDAAVADWKEKKAQADEALVTFNKMLLRAPFAGVLSKSNVYPGDYVTIGKALVQLTDIAHLRVEYNLPESFLPYLAGGQVVTVQSAAFPGQAFAAKLAYIAPIVNTSNRSIALYATLDNVDKKLAPGMFVNLVQQLGTRKKVMMIPARALMPIMNGEQVYKVTDGKAYAVEVVVGKHQGENVEILQGLNIGDSVITDGQLKVKNNMAVQIKE